MNTIKAIYKIVTPMFLGGADNIHAELRPPSFKGVLRFWFRAVALSILGSMDKVSETERQLFGSTDNKSGQSRFLLDIQPLQEINEVKHKSPWAGQGSAYLGYGVIEWDKPNKCNINKRGYISPGAGFEANLLLKRPFDEERECAIKICLTKALIAVGLFGGLGSRSRKGFGSIVLERLQFKDEILWEAPRSVDELKAKIANFFKEISPLFTEIPSFSAFSQKSSVSVYSPSSGISNPLTLLDEVGKEMLRYRSYGKKRENGKHELPWREEAEQKFKNDHDLMLSVGKGNIPQGHPRRVVFGLPHNYFFSDRSKINVNSVNNERRASPLFIHIHELCGQYVCIFTILPAVFLPEKDEIKMGNKPPVKVEVDYSVLTDFTKRFPGIMEVLPK